MTLLSACADNNLGTDTERESVIPEQNQKEDTNLYENELPEDATAEQVKEIIARKSNLWRNTNEMVK